MQLSEFSAIHPRDYLREGFLTADGHVRERINGYYSLGMAYRLQHEGVHPDTVKTLLDALSRFTDARMPKAGDKPLTEEDRRALLAAWPVASGGALAELREAATAHIHDWKQFSAALLHVERILKQLAVVHGAAAQRQ
jgi:hypothetical protein